MHKPIASLLRRSVVSEHVSTAAQTFLPASQPAASRTAACLHVLLGYGGRGMASASPVRENQQEDVSLPVPVGTRVCLKGLHRYVTRPRRMDAIIASRFLQNELPLRLGNQNAELRRLLGNDGCGLAAVLSPTLRRHRDICGKLEAVELLPRERHVVGSGPELLETGWQQAVAFSNNLREASDDMEQDLARAVAEGQMLVKTGGYSRKLDDAMDALHMGIITWRLLVMEHLKAMELLQGPPKNSVERRMWEMRVRTAISPACHVLDCLRNTAEDCRAFCIEKNSNSPDVNVSGDGAIIACTFQPHFEYVVTELLKNAMQPLVDRYGAWDVDEAPPVQVSVHKSPNDPGHFEVVVADKGGGIPRAKMETLFHWFSTSTSRVSADNYGYSRNHGSQFTGIGVGVNMARLYCAAMGGGVRWVSDDVGTTATVTLPLNAIKI